MHLAGIAPAVAQSAAKQIAAPDPEAIKQRAQELEAAREQQKKAAELEKKLKADIAAIHVLDEPFDDADGMPMVAKLPVAPRLFKQPL